jgi:hypothetical protein
VSLGERKCKKTFLSTEAGNDRVHGTVFDHRYPFLIPLVRGKIVYILFIQAMDTVLREYGIAVQEFKWNHMKTQVQVEVSLVLFISSGYCIFQSIFLGMKCHEIFPFVTQDSM